MASETNLMLGEDQSFDYPWQAQAFGITVALHKAGKFSWGRWVEVFTTEIGSAPAKDGESVNDAYYRQWLSALEKITLELGLVESGSAIGQRADKWRQAYLNTPHGSPVLLANADCGPAHVDHPPSREPVAVMPPVTSR